MTKMNMLITGKRQLVTAVLRQAGFRASFDAFFVYLSSVLRITFSGKVPPERKAANR
jgi:hypothetical protein